MHTQGPSIRNSSSAPPRLLALVCSPPQEHCVTQLSLAHDCRTHVAPDTFRGSWVRPGRLPFSSVCTLGPAQRDSVIRLFFVKYL